MKLSNWFVTFLLRLVGLISAISFMKSITIYEYFLNIVTLEMEFDNRAIQS